ncbi:GH32 C-terminal domain-containing protein [Pseudarthrobacter sp. SSS035]|uniref:GH32 C-terminal domain-containing protein n=1 Tax=Pseudarthrobacter sp. SSS035 TaxID=2931399 RepID=UPI00200CC53A|nr:GH32 C-terminal domain-containing protein [Pseudarthrobacter sp. SSS035]
MSQPAWTILWTRRSGPAKLPGGKLHLRAFVGRSAVEIFANGHPLPPGTPSIAP